MLGSKTPRFTFEVWGILKRPSEAEMQDFAEGQRQALAAIGVTQSEIIGTTLAPTDVVLVIRSESGTLIGGSRLFDSTRGKVLPLAAENSPLTEEVKRRIASETDVCEIGGLWISPAFAGRFLSRKLVEQTIRLCRDLGYGSILSLAHGRTFKCIAEPLGYEREPDVPAMFYPDPRFETVLLRCRLL
jgi:hypothetical protein